MRTSSQAALFAVAAIIGCGSQQSVLRRADKGLALALQATSAAASGFISWDRAKQDEIVEKALTLESGKKALASYRAKRDKILESFVMAYSSIALASSALALYEAGQVSEINVIQRFQETSEAVESVLNAVKVVRESP